MPDGNNILDILIRFGLDKSQATAATAEITKLEAATTRAGESGKKANDTAGKSAEEHTTKIHGLNKALNFLEHQFGDVGRIVGFAFHHPLAAAFAVIAVGMQKLNAASTELKERMVSLAQSTGASLGDMQGSLKATMIEFINSGETFKKSQDTLAAAVAKVTTNIEAQRDATVALLNARKEAELAGAGTPEAKAEIEERYKQAAAAASSRAAADLIRAKEAEIETQKAEQARLQAQARKDLGNQSPERAKVSLNDFEKRRGALDAEIKTTKEGLAYFEDMSPSKIISLIKEFGSMENVMQFKAGLEGRQSSAQRQKTQLDRDEARIRSGLRAGQDAEALGGTITAGETALGGMRTRYAGQWQAEALRRGGKPAATILDAAAGADALRGGAKSIDPQQSGALAELTKLLGLTGQSNQKILEMLSKLNDTQGGFDRALKIVQDRLNKQPPGL